jgi:hypothetical protein
MPVAEIAYPDLPRTGRYPTKHLVGQGGQYPQAAFHGLIVKTAEAIVPLLMHPLRLVGKDIKETQIAAELLSNFLRLEDQALPGSRLSHDIAAASAPVRPIGLTIVEKSRSRKSEQGDKWSFCLTAGTLWPANQERP